MSRAKNIDFTYAPCRLHSAPCKLMLAGVCLDIRSNSRAEDRACVVLSAVQLFSSRAAARPVLQLFSPLRSSPQRSCLQFTVSKILLPAFSACFLLLIRACLVPYICLRLSPYAPSAHFQMLAAWRQQPLSCLSPLAVDTQLAKDQTQGPGYRRTKLKS